MSRRRLTPEPASDSLEDQGDDAQRHKKEGGPKHKEQEGGSDDQGQGPKQDELPFLRPLKRGRCRSVSRIHTFRFDFHLSIMRQFSHL